MENSTKTLTRRDLLVGGTVAAGGMLLQACAHNGPSVASAGGAAGAAPALPGGLEVKGTPFSREEKPFFISGMNYWAAMPLARDANGAGWDRVRKDLDALQGAGINVIRTMGATEGPDTEPLRIVPTLQPAQGQYDPASVAGLVKLAEELRQRKLY